MLFNGDSLCAFLIASFSLFCLSIGVFSAPSYFDDPSRITDYESDESEAFPNLQSALAQLQAQQEANAIGPRDDPQQLVVAEEGLRDSVQKQLARLLQLSTPIGHVVGMALDPQNRLVLFHRSSRIWDEHSFDENNRFNRSLGAIPNATIAVVDSKSGLLLESHGQNLFYMPHGLTIDSEGNLWLTDVGSHQVHKLDKFFRPTMSLGEKLTPGSDAEHFCKPTDIAVSTNGDFFVADGYCNSRIMKFDRNGKLISQFGHQNSGNPPKSGEFFVPHSIALIEDLNLVCVADRENERIQCFSAGLEGTTHNRRAYVPTGTFVTKAENIGRIYAIREKEHFLVGVTSWDRNGQLEPQVFVMDMNTGKANSFAKGLANAHAVALSDGGDIFVSQLEPRQIVKFSIPSAGDAQ
ncbi:hypothetical protein niasHS_002467 [Heterodera schachtii]|uniref:peptidylamidoglycolate lyase n=1 Tax=Heterodera schachtii TaxID=97005 RepID=A0ABD2KK29_HETSC